MGKSKTEKREQALAKPKNVNVPKFRVKHSETGLYAYPGDGVPREEAMRLGTGLIESHKWYLEAV